MFYGTAFRIVNSEERHKKTWGGGAGRAGGAGSRGWSRKYDAGVPHLIKCRANAPVYFTQLAISFDRSQLLGKGGLSISFNITKI